MPSADRRHSLTGPGEEGVDGRLTLAALNWPGQFFPGSGQLQVAALKSGIWSSAMLELWLWPAPCVLGVFLRGSRSTSPWPGCAVASTAKERATTKRVLMECILKVWDHCNESGVSERKTEAFLSCVQVSLLCDGWEQRTLGYCIFRIDRPRGRQIPFTKTSRGIGRVLLLVQRSADLAKGVTMLALKTD